MLLVIASINTAFVNAPKMEGNPAILLPAYFRLCSVQQVAPLVADIAKEASPEIKKEIELAVAHWSADRVDAVRVELGQYYQQQSQKILGEFAVRYRAAEQSQDHDFLAQTAHDLGLRTVPKDYGALRAILLQTLLKNDLKLEASFLSEIETWLDLKQRLPDKTPPLVFWLTRKDRRPVSTASSTVDPAMRRPAQPVDPLVAAEAPSPNVGAVKIGSDVNPLDAMLAQEKALHEKRLHDTVADMQLIGSERKQYEDQVAAKKQAEAQAEANAMKHQAEQLAAVEQTALQQRENSWGNRLLNAALSIVGAGAGAAVSAAAVVPVQRAFKP